jgi:Tfp pilus assembly protein PilN
VIAVNLIPWPIQHSQARRRRSRAWAIATLGAVLVMCVPLLLNWLEGARVAAMSDETQVVQDELASMRESLRNLAAQVHETSLHLERAKALHAKRGWSALLAAISRCLPEDCWLTSVATDPTAPISNGRSRPNGNSGAAPPQPGGEGPTPGVVLIEGPRKLKLAGFAGDPGDPLAFVTNLKETGLFREVNLEGFRREPALGELVFRFDLVCEW